MIDPKRKEEEDNPQWLDSEYRQYIPEETDQFNNPKETSKKHCWGDCDDVGCNICLGS